MKRRLIQMAFVAMVCITTVVSADTLDSVKARMSKRQGAVRTLVNAAKLGEANNGFLAVRGSVSPDERHLMEAENADRKQVYQEIATKTGASVAQVGAQRARTIAQQAAKGSWVQESSGEWRQK